MTVRCLCEMLKFDGEYETNFSIRDVLFVTRKEFKESDW
jgi:hypothetical protein